MKLDKIKEKIKDKACEMKAAVDIKMWQAGQWAKENPEQAASVAIAALGAGVTIVRRIDRGARLRKETALKERYIYDRSLGSYWKLRRKPTKNELLRIETMKKAGMGYGDILTKLRLI